MLILLVEDDENKIDKILEFLKSFCPEVDLVTSNSLMSGLKSMQSKNPDLVLLDMTLPNFDGPTNVSSNKMKAFGGTEFIRQSNRLGLSGKIIVITQFESFGDAPNIVSFDDVKKDLTEKYPENFLNMIYYHASQAKWELELGNIIQDMKAG